MESNTPVPHMRAFRPACVPGSTKHGCISRHSGVLALCAALCWLKLWVLGVWHLPTSLKYRER